MSARSYFVAQCSLPDAVPDWDKKGEQLFEVRPCGEDVRLLWSLSIDIGELSEPIDENGSGGWASCSSWRVECGRGHVHATSAEDENAEPFTPDTLARLPFVELVEFDLRTGRPAVRS